MRCTDLDNGWVLLTALYKLVVCEFGVLILVHVPEDLVNALQRKGSEVRSMLRNKALAMYLLRSVLVRWELDHLSCHPVDGLDNLKHLIVGDGAIFINIVQLESP